MIDKGTTIILMKDAARIMKSKDTTNWIRSESTKLTEKRNNIYVMQNKLDTQDYTENTEMERDMAKRPKA